MIAPNILHLDNDESVCLEAHGTNKNVPVTINMYDFPLKHKQLFDGMLNLNNTNNHQAIFKVKVSLSKSVTVCLWFTYLPLSQQSVWWRFQTQMLWDVYCILSI